MGRFLQVGTRAMDVYYHSGPCKMSGRECSVDIPLSQCMQLLAWNVAFLAVPSVISAINSDTSSGPKSNYSTLFTMDPSFTNWTVAQVLSALSTFLAISAMANVFFLKALYPRQQSQADSVSLDMEYSYHPSPIRIFTGNFFQNPSKQPGSSIHGSRTRRHLSPLAFRLHGMGASLIFTIG